MELAGQVHRNLMEVNNWMGEAPGCELHRANGELFFASLSTLPFLNGVMRARAGGDAADLLARARSFFFDRGRGFVVFGWPADRIWRRPHFRRACSRCWSATRR